MEFRESSEQRSLREKAKALGQAFDDVYWRQVDEEERFPHEYWRQLAKEHFLGLTVSKEYGGEGLTLLDLAIATEALAEGGAGLVGSLPVFGPVFGGVLIGRHGSQEQKERLLPGLVHGEIWSGAFTEEASGSNVSAIGTRAEVTPDAYILHGRKNYVGVAQIASHVAILARTAPRDARAKTEAISIFIADLPNAQVEAHPLKKMGTRWMDTNVVTLHDLSVPRRNLVGEEGKAWKALYDVLNAERLVIAAAAIGTGLLCLRRAVEYAKGRTVWREDVPIAAYQGIQFPLVQAKMQIEAARLKVYHAAWLLDQSAPESGPAMAAAKYLAIHAGLDAADRAIQTLGGAGYLVTNDVERHWRDLRLARVAPVADEITMAYLASTELGMPRSY